MKISKIILSLVFFITLSIVAIHCGSDPASEGNKAFETGNYNLAIKHYLEAKGNTPAEQQQYNEKIALSYMLRGQDLYGRSKNVKSFSGNFDKSMDYIPDQPSEEFMKAYSGVLFNLGTAYLTATPENEIQREDYMNKAIGYLEDALVNDRNNQKADSLLSQIKINNFEKMLDKGNDFYEKAGRTNNGDHYITAEYYFQRAAYFDLNNQEAEKMLSKTRAKTLSILNNRQDFAMAVADMSRQGGNLILDLTIKNYATSPVSIDIANFEVVDSNGDSYKLNQAMMESKFSKNSLKNQKLGELKSVDGIIVFAVPSQVKLDYLGYRLDENETTKKYFP